MLLFSPQTLASSNIISSSCCLLTWYFRSSVPFPLFPPISPLPISLPKASQLSDCVSVMLDSQPSWADTVRALVEGESHLRQVITSSTSVIKGRGRVLCEPGAGKPDLAPQVPQEAMLQLSLEEWGGIGQDRRRISAPALQPPHPTSPRGMPSMLYGIPNL